MWNAIGLVAALAVAATALMRSRAPGGFYDHAVYGMAPAVHRRYAAISGAFAIVFAAALLLHAAAAGIVALGAYAVIAILYASSFLQGAGDYHE